MVARRRVYYGWYVLGTAGLGGMLSAGSSQLMIGALLLPITADTGWSHTAVSGALLLGTLASGLLSPLAGAVHDRHGPRWLMAGAGLALAAGFLVIGLGTGLVAFYLGYLLARAAAQGALGGAAQRAIAVRWFTRRRGRAMGFVTMSVPLGSAMLAFAAQWALRHGHGWREVFVGMGLAAIPLVVVPAVVLLRKSPEALGLAPDGVRPEPGRSAVRAAAEPIWRFADALRTPALRLIFAGSVCTLLANGTMVFYQVSFLIHQGVAPVYAVGAASALALAAAGANLMWGVLAERFPERGLAILSQLLAAVAVPGFLLVGASSGAALAYSALLGLVVRGEGAVVGLVLARYYGPAIYGRITGLLGSVQIIGLGLGPVLGALVYERTGGSYGALFAALGGCYALAAGCYCLARRPVLPASVQGGPQGA